MGLWVPREYGRGFQTHLEIPVLCPEWNGEDRLPPASNHRDLSDNPIRELLLRRLRGKHPILWDGFQPSKVVQEFFHPQQVFACFQPVEGEELFFKSRPFDRIRKIR